MTLDGGWPPGFPPATLREETRAMAGAWAEVLMERLPGAVRGIHVKGSALKPWDSPIDYVPGLSDVDIHLSLATAADEARLDSIDAALEVSAAVVAAYRRRIPEPLHLPRPQLVFVRRLEEDTSIVPSPASTVQTLFGPPYPDRLLTADEQAAARRRDRDELLQHAAFVRALPLRAIDRPGRYLVPLLSELNWRVSPTAPRVLELAGMAYAEAWTMNRTHLVAALRARGFAALADAYEAYYRAGWAHVVEGDTGAAVGDTLRAGAEVVRLGAAFAADHE